MADASACAEPHDPTDWEEWDPNTGSLAQHMVAGSAAGLLEHTCMYPVDTIKTHSQCARCGVSQSAVAVARDMVRAQGFGRMWRGVGTMFSGCVPAHAAYFSIFETIKRRTGADQAGHRPLAAAAAGAAATVAHDAIMTPMDMVKQRLQLGYYSGILDCFRTVLREEGSSALYRSFPVTLLMNVPYGMVMVSVNESLKRVLNPSNEQNLPAFLAAGAGGGLVASMVTCPLDVAKTRLQTQSIGHGGGPLPAPCASTGSVVIDIACDTKYITTRASGSGARGGSGGPVTPHAAAGTSASAGASGAGDAGAVRAPPGSRVVSSTASTSRPATVIASTAASSSTSSPAATTAAGGNVELQYRGLLDAMRAILREEGWRGFVRGMGPRVMTQAPAVAISWGAYETFKRLLRMSDADTQ